MRKPRGAVGIEVPEDEGVIPGGQEIPNGRSETWGAGGNRGNIYIIDIECVVVDGDGDCQVFGYGVVLEERVGVYEGVLDGMVDKDDETATAGGARAVTSDGGVVCEGEEFGARGQPGFLEAGDQDRLGMEEGGEFGMGVDDAVDIELEYGVLVVRW